jgi:hypothetical protein
MEERREQKTIEGFGRIFKPRYTRKGADGSRQVYENPIWWNAYYHNGEELRESSQFKGRERGSKALEAPCPRFGPWHRWHKRRATNL